MNGRQISVIVAVIVVLAGLLYYESQRSNMTETEAFAPAQSADESVPAAEAPIEPPAEVTAAPATEEPVADVIEAPSGEELPAEAPSTGLQRTAESSEGSPPAEPVPEPEIAAEVQMESPAMAETEPDAPALAEVDAQPEPEAAMAAEPGVSASPAEPDGQPLDRQTAAVEPGDAVADVVAGSESPATAEDTDEVRPVSAEPEVAVETPSEADDEIAAAATDDGSAMAEPPSMIEETENAVAATEPEAAPTESTQVETEVVADREPVADQTAMQDEVPVQPTEDEAAAIAEALEIEAPAETDVAMVEPETDPTSDGTATVEIGIVPTFDVVRVEPTGDTVVAGLAGRGSTVEIMDGPTVVATAEANERGEWALAFDQPLPPGTHDLAIRTTSRDETIVLLSDQRVAVSVPETGSEEALVVLNSPDSPSQVLQVPEVETDIALAESGPAATEEPATPEMEVAETSVDAAGGEDTPATDVASEETTTAAAVEESVEASEPEAAAADEPAEAEVVAEAMAEPEVAPAAEPVTTPQVGVAAVEADTAGGLFVAGTAETDETVRVYVDDEFVGEAEPSASGTWLVEVARELPEGTYNVRADQVEEGSGTVIARAEVPFEREIEVVALKPMAATTDDQSGAEVSAAISGPETVIIKRGDNLWRIARRLYGRGVRYSTIYQANREQIRDPHWIYPGQVFVLPEGNTNWEN